MLDSRSAWTARAEGAQKAAQVQPDRYKREALLQHAHHCKTQAVEAQEKVLDYWAR